MKLFFASLSLFFFLNGENSIKSYSSDNWRADFTVENNRLNGSYKSYYPDGSEKAVGTFKNNIRVGKWGVKSPNGIIKSQRVYSEYQSFTDEKNNLKLQSNVRNEKGLIGFAEINEADVLWSKRVWREVPQENNNPLFNHNKLMEVISKAVITGSLTCYSNQDDEFTIKLESVESILKKNPLVTSYRIKEETFFDKQRGIMETRIIGLAPQTNDNDIKKELFWIYYPELREILAEQNEIALDDIFTLRDFASQIVKESNKRDRSIADYSNDQEAIRESARIELTLIETEHDFWLR